jgi:hypothetical protein
MKLVFEEGLTKTYEHTGFLPGIYFATGVVNVKSDETALSYISNPDFSPIQETVVMGGNINKQAEFLQNESVQIIETKYGNMTMKTDTLYERLLVISNPKYPGWNAYIDGNRTDILSVNYLFMGILVPKGQHTILVEYQ